MARDIRVLVWGLGSMGTGIVRALAAKRGVVIAGAVCSRTEKEGIDVGELAELGAPVGAVAMCNGNFAVQLAKPDVVVIAQASSVVDSMEAIETSLAYDADVVCIAEEMSYPWRAAPDLAPQIQQWAERAGRTVLGTGINPGFVLDTLVVALTGCCLSVERISARRVNDLSPYGPTVLAAQGVGLTPDRFDEAVASGEVVGHVGFPESIAMIADAVGFKLTEVRESREPIVSTVRREVEHATVESGQVAGCRQRAWGLMGDHAVIELDHPQQVRPEAEGVATSDFIQIAGDPPISLTIEPEIAGGVATVALAVNSIPLVMKAPPGLVAMTDLPVPRASLADMRWLLRKSPARGRLYEAAEPGEEAAVESDEDDAGDLRSAAREVGAETPVEGGAPAESEASAEGDEDE